MNKFLLENQESARLIFRKININDFNEWLEFFKHPDAAKYLLLPELKPEELCNHWFKLVLDRYEQGRGGLMALIEKSSGNFIGQCGLLVQEVDGINEIEIGYSLIPKYWGKGFAIEAAVKCKEYAFEYNLVDSLISIIHKDNSKSISVALKNGMHFEKISIFRGHPVNIYRINNENINEN